MGRLPSCWNVTDQQDLLLGLAEVAIALAGFAAIVVVLKRRESGAWARADADPFHGMIMHAVCAVGFCLLPFLVDVYVQDMVTTLHGLAGILGVQLIAHSIGVMRMPTTARWGRIAMTSGILVGLTQGLVFTGWGVHRELQIYAAGIVWHIVRAGVLFVMLVWIPETERH